MTDDANEVVEVQEEVSGPSRVAGNLGTALLILLSVLFLAALISTWVYAAKLNAAGAFALGVLIGWIFVLPQILPHLLIIFVVYLVGAFVFRYVLIGPDVPWPPLTRRKIAKRIAIAVLVVMLFNMMFLTGFLEAQPRSKVSRTRTDLRGLSVALDSYWRDHKALPPTLDSLIAPKRYFFDEVPLDPFSPGGSEPYEYFLGSGNDEHRWVLIGRGPDRDFDLVPAEGSFDWSLRLSTPGLLPLTYDPTNGTVSNGDIWRVSD